MMMTEEDTGVEGFPQFVVGYQASPESVVEANTRIERSINRMS